MYYSKIYEVPIYASFLIEIVVCDDEDILNNIHGLGSYPLAFVTRSLRTYRKVKERKCLTVGFYAAGKDLDSSIVVHEIVHIKNMLFGDIGLENDPDNDEAEAYFMEWLFKVVNKEFLKGMKIYNDEQSFKESSNSKE